MTMTISAEIFEDEKSCPKCGNDKYKMGNSVFTFTREVNELCTKCLRPRMKEKVFKTCLPILNQ